MGKYLEIQYADFSKNAASGVILEDSTRWIESIYRQYPNYQYNIVHNTAEVRNRDKGGEPCLIINVEQCTKLWGFSAGLTAYYGNNTIDYGVYSEIPSPSNWSECVLGYGELHNMSERNTLILPDNARYILISDYAGAGVTMSITAYTYTPYRANSIYEKEYVSDIFYNKAYLGSGSNAGTLADVEGWCSCLIKKSDCVLFTPLGFTIETISASPNNAVGYNSETPSHSTFVLNKEPIDVDVNNKYVVMFDNNAIVAYGINYNIGDTTIIQSLKISFFK